jgi:hypothetical protein
MPCRAARTVPERHTVAYLDPWGHVHTIDRPMAERLREVRGAVAALLDNGNDTARFFFEGLRIPRTATITAQRGSQILPLSCP